MAGIVNVGEHPAGVVVYDFPAYVTTHFPTHTLPGLAEYPYCAPHDVVVPPTGHAAVVPGILPDGFGVPTALLHGGDGGLHCTLPPDCTHAGEHCTTYTVAGAPDGSHPVITPIDEKEHDGGLGSGAGQLFVHPDGGVFLLPELPPFPLPPGPYPLTPPWAAATLAVPTTIIVASMIIPTGLSIIFILLFSFFRHRHMTSCH